MRLKLATAAVLSTLIAAPAFGQDAPPQPTCKAIDQMEAYLASKYQETKAGVGRSDDGMLTMLFRSEGTYTVVKVRPDKLSCIVDFGSDWQARSDAAPVPETGL
jgi:hypothetical protein